VIGYRHLLTSPHLTVGACLQLEDGHHGTAQAGSNVSDHEATKNGDSKALRRLAQNREAARKSRLRKKAYVQQLESSRIKLNQLEQELQRARQQVRSHASSPL
jgi:transcription factor TGA